MPVATSARELLDQEALALLTRLDRVKPFALHETMVPAAALAPAAQSGIEQFLISGRRSLRRRVLAYLDWLRSDGRAASPADQQRRFTVIRLQFNNVLTQLDVFTEVVSQRSEHQTGVWLSGLDVLATDALGVVGDYFEPPPLVCYLARGPGAAIRRARTRLPGGGLSPVAIIRVPRERMVGHGIASSLVHEVGHQGAALLELVESLRPVLQATQREVDGDDAKAWRCWERWISEIVADFWSIGTLGLSSTLGLFAVVSLPKWFVFRPSGDDPHPTPYVRVLLSAAIGDALYPHPQWSEMSRVWKALYPIASVTDDHRRRLERLLATLPDFARQLADHRPASLRGRSLGEVMPVQQRRPERLLAFHAEWRGRPEAMVDHSPSLVFAVIGQARAAGLLTPRTEAGLISTLLTHWALRSTLDIAAVCADRSRPRPGLVARAS